VLPPKKVPHNEAEKDHSQMNFPAAVAEWNNRSEQKQKTFSKSIKATNH
jgi:hypothetical protein